MLDNSNFRFLLFEQFLVMLLYLKRFVTPSSLRTIPYMGRFIIKESRY